MQYSILYLDVSTLRSPTTSPAETKGKIKTATTRRFYCPFCLSFLFSSTNFRASVLMNPLRSTRHHFRLFGLIGSTAEAGCCSHAPRRSDRWFLACGSHVETSSSMWPLLRCRRDDRSCDTIRPSLTRAIGSICTLREAHSKQFADYLPMLVLFVVGTKTAIKSPYSDALRNGVI